MNFQMFSTGLSSGDFGGSGRMAMFSGTARLLDENGHAILNTDPTRV